ncbi:helix-turn-helix domain-containing protein [Cellulosilyticum sp. I15G10I2]|uniref:helix-turn-helix domain-containing protein n=1 Tax=Cellulosilyticum sp. I15G10I2 TaxID=1892843 RepID=UPI00085BDE4F|nr:helix-turn-helix domain-containing protein [Cellulosilyticum sp. I15G10I2]
MRRGVKFKSNIISWRGFQRYLYKIILSNIFLILIPICILGIFWYAMMFNQAENKFYEQKSIALNEIVSSINHRINAVKLELSAEILDRKYSTYTFSTDDYSTNLSMLIRKLYTVKEKYHIIDSVSFYDITTGKIYNSKSGRYAFDDFYDKKWLDEIDKNIYSIQQLPLRYAFDNEELLDTPNNIYSEFNKLVLSIVLKGRPHYYLMANVSIDRLYNEIADTYNVPHYNEEFFLLNSDGQLVVGKCNYSNPETLLASLTSLKEKEVTYIKENNRIYFLKLLDFGIYCVASYPAPEAYQESHYLGKYILVVCLSLIFFLLIISVYMAKRLYQPINTLYSDISENTKSLHKSNIYDEIDMLKLAFSELSTFNANAKLKLVQFDEINKAFNFRSFLENSRDKEQFVRDHPYLFDEDGNCLCEMLILKFDITDMLMSVEEETLFLLNLQEVLRTYLQTSMKGVLTKIEDDNLILLYHSNEREDLEQTRKILTNTIIKLTHENAYFGLSQPIQNVGEIITQYQICCDLIKASYFFSWKNEIITEEMIENPKDMNDIYNMLININASFIRCIVSQDESGITELFKKLEVELRKIKNYSQVKDIYNRILVELDHEFHFSSFIETNLLQALNDNKTLVDMMNFIKNLLMQVSQQYGNNDAKENNYCELAMHYLDNHYMKDMNITDTADDLKISYSYLSKIFRARTGMTLTDYLNNTRIEKSKEYLTNTFLTLSEISKKVGYNNVQSYQRFFKKYVNLTPGDYRKLHENKK